MMQKEKTSLPSEIDLETSEEPLALEHIPFHAKTIESCFELLTSRFGGLTQDEVGERLKQYGQNQIDEGNFKTNQRIFLSQFKKLIFFLLFGAALFSIVSGHFTTALVITGAMFSSIGFNFFTQWVSQQNKIEMNPIQAASCQVRREGKVIQIPTPQLVPGDILILNSGDVIPVDARLILSQELQMDESLLSGESILVRKDAKALHIPDLELSEQSNRVFAGCRVKTGKGEALVTATGKSTIMGEISKLARRTEKRDSFLTRELNKMGFTLLGGALLLSSVILAIQFHRGVPAIDLIPYGLVLLIAAVPETLPSMATFILSLGLRKFSQQSILIKNLQTMESLGNISVICTDKTGTLTQNSLTLQQICIPELGNIPYDPQWKDGKNIPNPSIEAFLKISRLNNTTIMDGIRSAFIGDPIDIALYRSSSSLLEKGYHRLREIPFDSNTLKTATILKDPNGYCIAMIKGAPEAVIGQCQAYLSPTDGEAYLLSPSHRNELLLANQDLAFEQGLRVIGFAQKYLNDPNEDPYTGATFIGWGCLVDPPKAGVLEAIQACEEIGLRIIMITGDQKATAAVTANQLGILKPDSAIWTRKDLDSGVDKLPQNVRVFARTKPEEKLAIVESLQKSGEVVAMIGDGVNDTPALQKSDIAIAMGLHGTDAAKESSDIILLNDRLDKILETILTSRALMVNIKLCAHYIISCSMGLLFFLVAAAFLGLGLKNQPVNLPLNLLEILWLNIVVVMIPCLTLAFKPTHPKLLKGNALTNSYQKPIQQEDLPLLSIWAVMIMLCGLGTYCISHFYLHHPTGLTNSLTFSALAIAQIFHLLNIHLVYSGHKLPVFLSEIFQVPAIPLTLIISLGLQYLVVSQEPLQGIFQTQEIAPLLWLIPIGLTLLLMGSCLFFTKIETEETPHPEAQALSQS